MFCVGIWRIVVRSAAPAIAVRAIAVNDIPARINI